MERNKYEPQSSQINQQSSQLIEISVGQFDDYYDTSQLSDVDVFDDQALYFDEKFELINSNTSLTNAPSEIKEEVKKDKFKSRQEKKKQRILQQYDQKCRQEHERLVQKIKQKGPAQHEYWKGQQNRRWFEIYIHLNGINNINWRKILDRKEFYGRFGQHQVTRQLGRYKQLVKDQYRIEDKKELLNTMYNKKSPNSDILKIICSYWQNPNFQGFTEEQINYYMNK